MPDKPIAVPVERIELLDETAALSLSELARCCSVSTQWVLTHVEAGVLQAERGSGEWRFAGSTLRRARRIVQLERTWDADPQLAALAVDLMEEVRRLRRELDVLTRLA